MPHPGLNGDRRPTTEHELYTKHTFYDLQRLGRSRVTSVEGHLIIGGKTRHEEMARRKLRPRLAIPAEERKNKRPDNWQGVTPEDLDTSPISLDGTDQRFHPGKVVTYGPSENITLADFPGAANLLSLR
jgi:hypothetical protein